MLTLISLEPKNQQTGALVIPVCEDRQIHGNESIMSLTGLLDDIDEFRGRPDDEVILYKPETVPARRILFLGVGKEDKLSTESFRRFAGKAVKRCVKKNISDAVIVVPDILPENIDQELLLAALMEGGYLGNHIDNRFMSEKKRKPLEAISFGTNADTAKHYGNLAQRIENVCDSTVLAREWVSTPSNEKRPEAFAASLLEKGEREGLHPVILDKPALERDGFGGITAVGKGSDNGPLMVILEHKPENPRKKVVLVGKGVTFDSGGLDLKPRNGMADMKSDMAGAATVAGTLIAVSRQNLDVHVIGLIPIVENMPSGKAYRRGDILRAYNGKTVEIGNTDAEGRLILMDALSYGEIQYEPDIIIDAATLTGACVIALGKKIAGLFTPDDDLADALVRAGEKTHERCWKMPLPDDYRETLKSEIADTSNVGKDKWAGAISAALFLSGFVKNSRWAHIDIAGPAFANKESDYCGPGGTGFGVRLLFDFLDHVT